MAKARPCDSLEADLLAGWIAFSGGWRSSFGGRDVAGPPLRGWAVQDQATQVGNENGKSAGGSQLPGGIRTIWRRLGRSHGGIGLRLLASVLLFSSAITLFLTLLQ